MSYLSTHIYSVRNNEKLLGFGRLVTLHQFVFDFFGVRDHVFPSIPSAATPRRGQCLVRVFKVSAVDILR